MAYELIAAIKGTKEGIGLVSEVLRIIKELPKSDKNPDLRTLLDELKQAARNSIRTLDFAIKDIRDMLVSQDLPSERSLAVLISNTSWYRWPSKFRLSRLNKAVRNLEDDIHTLMGDVTALLICSGQMEGAGKAYATGFQTGLKILDSAPLAMPLGDLLAHFKNQVGELEVQVEDL